MLCVVSESAGSSPAEPGTGNEVEPWPARFAARLAVAAGATQPLLTPREQARVLRLARDVAHGSERKYAPLAAFIAGRYVELRIADGVDAATALDDVTRAAAELLSDSTATP